MRRVLLMLAVLILFVHPSFGDDFSTISTTFKIKRSLPCDEVFIRFDVWASGDNYQSALNRLKPVSFRFLNFLDELFSKKEIKTRMDYGYADKAIEFVIIKTNKINQMPKILNFISAQKFDYQTGIKVSFIRFGLSDKRINRTRILIFKEALLKSKGLLHLINKTMNGGYKISLVDVRYNFSNAVAPIDANMLFRSAPKKGFKLPVGQRTVEAVVKFQAKRLFKK